MGSPTFQQAYPLVTLNTSAPSAGKESEYKVQCQVQPTQNKSKV